MFCGYDTLEGANHTDVEGHPMRCKRWTCELCQPLRCAQLRELASSGKPNVFITLTASDECGDDPDQIARGLVRAWRDIIQRGRREGRWTKPQYLCVFEETRRHRPHLHILWRGPYIPQKWLSERMDQYMASPIVYVEAVRNRARAASYVAKYVSKAPWRWKGTKRYWRSMKWRLHEVAWRDNAQRPWRTWMRIQAMAGTRAADLAARGWTVIACGERGYRATPPHGEWRPPGPQYG